MKKPALLILLPFLIASCSSTELVFLSVKQPAPVTIPGYIKTVGVIDRSKASKETKTIDAIEKAVSLQGPGLDQEGAKSGISGLTTELMKNTRFDQVKPLTMLDLRSTGAGVFPAALSWDMVDQICRENNTDALFSLELFDADSRLTYAANPVNLQTGIANVAAIEHQANMVTTVKTGWRIYDPSSRNILDEYIMSKSISFSGRGVNPVVAASALVGRKDAVMQVSDQAGQAYAMRILPCWIRVSRDYFVRGTDNFRMARRKAQTGNWDEAAKLWQQETGNGSPKIAGRACYNMAIISEINGDVDGAISWAQKAYENYNLRLALHYVNILKDRKADNAVLADQQPNQQPNQQSSQQ